MVLSASATISSPGYWGKGYKYHAAYKVEYQPLAVELTADVFATI